MDTTIHIPWRGLTPEEIAGAKTTIWTKKTRGNEYEYVYLVIVLSKQQRYPLCLGRADHPLTQKVAAELRAIPIRDLIESDAIHVKIAELRQHNHRATKMDRAAANGRKAWLNTSTVSTNMCVRVPFLPGEMSNPHSQILRDIYAEAVRDPDQQEREHVRHLLARELLDTLHRDHPKLADAVWRDIVLDGRPASDWSPETQTGLRKLRELAGVGVDVDVANQIQPDKHNGDTLLLVDLIEGPRRRKGCMTIIEVNAEDLASLLAERPAAVAQLVLPILLPRRDGLN